MRSADLIREARLRAGLSQHELAARSGRDRSVIARWEQAVVAPSVETLVELVRACGFDLPLELVPDDRSAEVRLETNALLSPERKRVTYIVIGAFARVIQGAEEVTDGIDVVVSLREENLRRLAEALEELGARRVDGKKLALSPVALAGEPVLALATDQGELKVVPRPAGTRDGYNDLRRAATREPIGKGLRPSVASVGDLARMLAALGREQEAPQLRALRRIAELERGPRLER